PDHHGQCHADEVAQNRALGQVFGWFFQGVLKIARYRQPEGERQVERGVRPGDPLSLAPAWRCPGTWWTDFKSGLQRLPATRFCSAQDKGETGCGLFNYRTFLVDATRFKKCANEFRRGD